MEASLRGKHVYLRAVLPGEYEDLYLRETSGDLARLGGLEGATPPFEEWLKQRWAATLARFVVLREGDHGRLGLVSLFNADLRNGHAHLALTSFDSTKPSPLVMVGCGLFIDHAFSSWPLHKLYLDVAEYNLDRFSSGVGRLFDAEGRLSKHHYLDGRYWDHHILALSKERWTPLLGSSCEDGSSRRRRSMSEAPPVGLEGFAAEVAEIVQADPAGVRGDSRLVADLDFDSLAFVELAVLLMDRYDSRNFMGAVSGEVDVGALTVESVYENYAR